MGVMASPGCCVVLIIFIAQACHSFMAAIGRKLGKFAVKLYYSIFWENKHFVASALLYVRRPNPYMSCQELQDVS